MKVAVRFFARYREAAGRDHIELEVPEGGTVEAAWEAVASRFPVLQPYRPFTLFALGTDYVQPNHPLRPGDEVCLFPPVSGGSDGDWVEVTASPLSEDRLAAHSEVLASATGPKAATPAAVRARWPGVRKVALVHRIGRLEIGESSVMIAVASPHRAEAFEACHFAIDTLKTTVPVWKKEYFEDGEVWVGLQGERSHGRP
ncbi:MAG: molybdopterin converting factor [Candidatus Rokuibacteriota bacterium]|nr:MAG: molybdopterin converting factor [Candidatus Rokubacteria bacterium]